MIVIPNLIVKPNQLVIYNSFQTDEGFSFSKRGKHLPTTKKAHNNIVSSQAKNKIDNAINYMLLVSNSRKKVYNYNGKDLTFKISFVTLTLSSEQIHSDLIIRDQLLNQFFVEMKHRHKISEYIWKAEKQNNGNIHFHILLNKFIPHDELRKIWNRIQNKLGYVDRYASKMKLWHSKGFRVREDLLRSWHEKLQYSAFLRGEKDNWHNPNSTDIHSIRNIINLGAYFKKYLTKSDANHVIEGRLWSCSENLSKINKSHTVIDSTISADLKKINDNYPGVRYDAEYFTTFNISVFDLAAIGCYAILSVFIDNLNKHFSKNYTLDMFST